MHTRSVLITNLNTIIKNNVNKPPMMNDCTLNNLVRYIYSETSAKESRQIASQLEKNWELKDHYTSLLAATEALDDVPMKKPHPTSINIILDYSRSSQAEEQQQLETQF